MFGNAATANRPIPGAVATLGVDERREFLKKTYAHLAAAIVAFVVFAALLVNWEMDNGLRFTAWAFGSGFNWLIVLGLFMVVGYVADKWARSDTSPGMQYLGLGLYTAAQALITTPLLVYAHLRFEGAIQTAGLLTILLFAGLTATVFLTKKDFSFLRGALAISGLAAIGVIVASILFGFTLGLFFSGLMVVFASGYVLYYTSQVLAHWRPTQHVAASLALFSAVALMFWYVLRIVIALRE
jgi:FtsH-binding integral membrane protein